MIANHRIHFSGFHRHQGRGALHRILAAATAKKFVLAVGVLLLGIAGWGCREEGMVVWCHQGQEAENTAMREMVAAFNEAHGSEGLHVVVRFFPDDQYADKVAGAVSSGDLPDALDLDGPLLAKFVADGVLQPMDPWITETQREDFLRTIIQQGTIDGKLYALGAFDSALVLYYDKRTLEDAGVRPPPEGEGWTWEEFLSACEALKSAGHEPVAMHMNESAGEWYMYAFSPILWSAGGALIGEDGRQVEGVLNSDVNVRALREWQKVFTRGYAATNPVNPDPFGSGETAMDWTGHWLAPSHIEAKGDRLGVMPLPTTGEERVAPCGSWCWGISATTEDPEAAAEWVRWAVHPTHGVEPMVEANGAIPARKSAFDEFPEYQEMPYRLFRAQLEQWARPRPRTPHYATLREHAAAALQDIARGSDVRERLDTAAAAAQRFIDRQYRGRE